MSNDGNKSTRRVPFTMFSSSAEGGYLEDFHTNFTGGVTVANMHTDTYGDFRHPPMQGPFTEDMVGGQQRRHTPINRGDDQRYSRPELFDVGFGGDGSLTVSTALPHTHSATGEAFATEVYVTNDPVALVYKSSGLPGFSNGQYLVNLAAGLCVDCEGINPGTFLNDAASSELSEMGLAVDSFNSHYYYTTNENDGKIWRGDLYGDPVSPSSLFYAPSDPDGGNDTRGIACDPNENVIFWVNRHNTNDILTASMTDPYGTVGVIVDNPVVTYPQWIDPYQCTVDSKNKKLYIVGETYNNVFSCSYDGTNFGPLTDLNTLVDTTTGFVTNTINVNITIDEINDEVYVTSPNHNGTGLYSNVGFIWKSNLDGTEPSLVMEPSGSTESPDIVDIAVDPVNDTLYMMSRQDALDGNAGEPWNLGGAHGQGIYRCSLSNPGTGSSNGFSKVLDTYGGRGFNIDLVYQRLVKPWAPYYRDEFAKRPVNIRNIKINSPGNYSQEYEVIQIAGRTLNPRHYAEYPEQYTTDFPLHRGTEGRVLNTLNAEGQPATGTLPDYTMPDNVGSTNNFIFVNKFSAPGDRYTMSRGFLNPKGEELSAYNASPFRNLTVREELAADLTRHSPQATNIPPAVPTQYHTTNRNAKIARQESPAQVIDIIDNLSDPSGIAIDEYGEKIYWTDETERTINRANLDGSDSEVLYTQSGTSALNSIKLDIANQKLYVADGGSSYRDILEGDMDGSSGLVTIYDGPNGFPEGLSLDLINRNAYWTDKTLNKIFRAPMVPGSSREELYEETVGTTTLGGMDLDIEAGYMYWTDNGSAHESIYRAGLQIPVGETPSTRTDVEQIVTIPGTTKLEDVILNFVDKRMYFTDSVVDVIKSADFDGSNIEELLDLPSTTIRRLALIPSRGDIYWTEADTAPGKIQKCSTPFRKVYDNANVTHGIPQSTLQYSWIHDSALTTRTEFPGFATGSDLSFYPATIGWTITPGGPGGIIPGEFPEGYWDETNLEVFPIDGPPWAGTDTVWDLVEADSALAPIDAGSLTNGIWEVLDANNITPGEYDVDYFGLCGPMNCVFNNPVTAVQSFDFTGSVYGYSSWKEIRGGELSLSRYYRNHNILPVANIKDEVAQFIEPPVVAKHMPLDYVLGIKGAEAPYLVRSAYGNTLVRYSNDEINKMYNFTVSDKDTEYSKIKSLYLDRSPAEPNNPVTAFYSLTYGQTLWPQDENSFMKKTRLRTKYTEIAGTGSDGYDRLYGTQNTMYSKTKMRDPTALNSMGEVDISLAFDPMKTDGIRSFPASSSYSYNVGELNLDTDLAANCLSPLTAEERAHIEGQIAEILSVKIPAAEEFIEQRETDIAKYEANYAAVYAMWQDCQDNPGTCTSGEIQNLEDEMDELGAAIKLAIVEIAEANEQIDDAQALVNSLSAQLLPLVCEATASLDFFESNYIRLLSGSTTINTDYNERLVEQMSGIDRWYNSYDLYSANEVGLHKEASILPEFRISEHMDYYIDEKGGNFRSDNTKFLSILGAEYSSSGDSYVSINYNTDFEETYMLSEEFENLEKIRNDHLGHSSPKQITIKATGIKKLLPYNGFYPDTRTVQLGNELKNSLYEDIPEEYTKDIPNSLITLIKPLTSPGILYNSLKAGLAVDYPCYSSPVVNGAYEYEGPIPNNYIYKDPLQEIFTPDFRLPFETLVNLNGNLPTSLPFTHVYRSPNLEVYATGSDGNYEYVEQHQWTGKKKPQFELGCHNFLASSVKFFLQDEKINSFMSAPETAFKIASSDKTYYMDIVLRDEIDMNRFVEYTSTVEIFPAIQSAINNLYEQPAPPTNIIEVEVVSPDTILLPSPTTYSEAATPTAEILEPPVFSDWLTFGHSVAVCESPTQPDERYMLVGDPRYRSGSQGEMVGAVHLYLEQTGNLSKSPLLTITGSKTSDGLGSHLGHDVAMINYDGKIFMNLGEPRYERKSVPTVGGTLRVIPTSNVVYDGDLQNYSNMVDCSGSSRNITVTAIAGVIGGVPTTQDFWDAQADPTNTSTKIGLRGGASSTDYDFHPTTSSSPGPGEFYIGTNQHYSFIQGLRDIINLSASANFRAVLGDNQTAEGAELHILDVSASMGGANQYGYDIENYLRLGAQLTTGPILGVTNKREKYLVDNPIWDYSDDYWDYRFDNLRLNRQDLEYPVQAETNPPVPDFAGVGAEGSPNNGVFCALELESYIYENWRSRGYTALEPDGSGGSKAVYDEAEWVERAEGTLEGAPLESTSVDQHGAVRLLTYEVGAATATPVDIGSATDPLGIFPPPEYPLYRATCGKEEYAVDAHYGFEFGSSVTICSSSYPGSTPLSASNKTFGIAFAALPSCAYNLELLPYLDLYPDSKKSNIWAAISSSDAGVKHWGTTESDMEFNQQSRKSLLYNADYNLQSTAANLTWNLNQLNSKKLEMALSYYSGSTISTNIGPSDRFNIFIADSARDSSVGAYGSVKHFYKVLTGSGVPSGGDLMAPIYFHHNTNPQRQGATDVFMISRYITTGSGPTECKVPLFTYGFANTSMAPDQNVVGSYLSIWQSTRDPNYDQPAPTEVLGSSAGITIQDQLVASPFSKDMFYGFSLDAHPLGDTENYYIIAGCPFTLRDLSSDVAIPADSKTLGNVAIYKMQYGKTTDGTTVPSATGSLIWRNGPVDQGDSDNNVHWGRAVSIYCKPDPNPENMDEIYCAASHTFYRGRLDGNNRTTDADGNWPREGSPIIVPAGKVDYLFTSTGINDYKMHGSLFGQGINDGFDPAYCAFTPPGFYGDSVARVSFKPPSDGKFTLEQILEGLQIDDILNINPMKMRFDNGHFNQLDGDQSASKMKVGASVNLVGRTNIPGVTFAMGSDGQTSRPSAATSDSSDSVAWSIHTRFESPVLQVSSSAYGENYSSHVGSVEDLIPSYEGSSSFVYPRSVWTSEGTTPTAKAGYMFELRESFTDQAKQTTQAIHDGSPTGSLIQLCGFTPATKKIGKVAEKRTISEAIMVIPYLDRPIKSTARGTSRKTVEIDNGMNFIRLNKSELKRQMKNIDDSGYAVSEDVPVTSYSEMIDGMKKYVIPPKYNFMRYKDITPFAAYFLEFEHTLTQEDLNKIWQGIMPEIGQTPEIDDIEISHDFDKHNFFHNMSFPTDIKFLVFKVKEKAEWNYYNITTDSTDDNRFRFDFQGDGKAEAIPDYSYNWPYDFCTLVERAKVDVSVTFKKPEEKE